LKPKNRYNIKSFRDGEFKSVYRGIKPKIEEEYILERELKKPEEAHFHPWFQASH